jgi:hypothetical protein
MSKSQDIAFGTKNEISCKELIESITGTLTQTEPYHLFDYYNEEYLVELKARRNEYNKYPTTMVGKNKIDKAKREQFKKCMFCFKFFDGLYYHFFDSSIDYQVKKGGRCDRGCPEIKDYVYIPINLLTKLI